MPYYYLSWQHFEADAPEGRFEKAAGVDLQTNDAIARDCANGLGVVDGLVAVDPKLNARAVCLYDIRIPIIRSEHSGHRRLVCGGEHSIAARLIVETSPIVLPNIRLVSADLLGAGNALASKLNP